MSIHDALYYVDVPEVCPITGRPFFRWISHPVKNRYVPTYGGPYDSYTIPVKQPDGSFECERYDEDEGRWCDGEYYYVDGRLISDSESAVNYEKVEKSIDFYLKYVEAFDQEYEKYPREFQEFVLNSKLVNCIQTHYEDTVKTILGDDVYDMLLYFTYETNPQVEVDGKMFTTFKEYYKHIIA